MYLMPPNLTLKDGGKFCYVYFTTNLKKLKETVYHKVKVFEGFSILFFRVPSPPSFPGHTLPTCSNLFLGSIL